MEHVCTKLFYSLYVWSDSQQIIISYKLRLRKSGNSNALSAKQFCNLLLAMPRIINGSINMAPFYTTIIIWAPCRCGKYFASSFFLYCTLMHWGIFIGHWYFLLCKLQFSNEPSLQGELGKSLKLCPYKGIMFKVSTRTQQNLFHFPEIVYDIS